MKTLTILLTLLVAIGAWAQNEYQTFGPKTSNPNCRFGFGGIQVTAINDSGQALGWSCPGGEAFLISRGDVWTRKLVRTNGSPLLMNNAATIIGVEGPSNQAFFKLWEQPVSNLGNHKTASAINTAGYIAGTTTNNTPNGQTEVYLINQQGGGSVIKFPRQSGPPWANDWNNELVTGLNNLNQVVGSWEDYSTPWSGFFYDDKSKQLNTTFNMPGAITTYPTAINDNQEVVGNWYDENGVEHGFYWNPTAGFSDIDVAGDTAMFLVGINNSSVILGAWQDDNTPMKFHFVTIVNGQPTASVNVPKSLQTWGTAINNVGQVVGEYETQAGVWRGFIYTPSK